MYTKSSIEDTLELLPQPSEKLGASFTSPGKWSLLSARRWYLRFHVESNTKRLTFILFWNDNTFSPLESCLDFPPARRGDEDGHDSSQGRERLVYLVPVRRPIRFYLIIYKHFVVFSRTKKDPSLSPNTDAWRAAAQCKKKKIETRNSHALLYARLTLGNHWNWISFF